MYISVFPDEVTPSNRITSLSFNWLWTWSKAFNWDSDKSFVFELTGAMDKINSFIDLLRPLGLNDISRTGLAAIARGSKN